MTFTKQVARHDKISIDSTDYSNAFRSFNLASNDTTVDASGFSVSGTDETLSGTRAQSFTGDMFYTQETGPAMWTLYQARTIFPVSWQPDGLVDNTRETYVGNCQIRDFPPVDTRGDVSVMTLTFTAADDAGIHMTGT